MNEWEIKTLGDLVTLQRGFDLPDSRRKEGEVPVIGSFGITGFHNEAAMAGPGVTVGRSGASIGVVSYIDSDYWPLNTCLYVKDFHGNDPQFAYYCLKALNLAHYNSGSAQPSLNRNYIHPLPLAFPKLPEQKAIAQILGSLDDKIELNRRINETLEQMARAIFKDWFIDFGPTRAKMESRDPYLPHEIWSLFPDRFDEGSGLPIGWETYLFQSIVSVKDGTHDSPKASNFGYPLVISKHLKNGYIDFGSTYLISEDDFVAINQRSKVDKFDILITMIGTVGIYCSLIMNLLTLR